MIFYFNQYIFHIKMLSAINRSFSDSRALSVSFQPFGAGDDFRRVARLFKTIAERTAQSCNDFEETADRETACKPRACRCWQGVIYARRIITENFRGMFSYKKRTEIFKQWNPRVNVVGLKFEVFRRDCVGNTDRLLFCFIDNNKPACAKRSAGVFSG